MDKNLHKLDDIFNSAYQHYEEDPSGTSWEKVNAALDKQDAESYKKRFVGWKRTAIIMCALLGGLVIYESGIFEKDNSKNPFAKTGTRNENANSNPLIDKGEVKPTDKSKEQDKGEITSNANSDRKAIKSASPDNMLVENKNVNKQTEQDKTTNVIIKNRYKTSLDGRVIVKNDKESINGNNNETSVNVADTKEIANRHRVKTGDFEPVDDAGLNSSYKNEEKTTQGSITNGRLLTASIYRSKRIPSIVPPDLNPDSLYAKAGNNFSGIKPAAKMFKPYFSLTAFGSTDFGRYKLDNDKEDNIGVPINEKKEIDGRESNEVSFSGGLLANLQLTKHAGIKMGLIYANTAILIDPQLMYASLASDGNVAYKYITSSGYGYVKPGPGSIPAIGDSIQSATTQHNLEHVSIPLMATYKIGLKKISIIPSAGIAANFIARASVKTEVTNTLNREAVNIGRLKGLKHFYMSGMVDANLQYNLNNRVAFNIIPSFNYAIAPINTGNVVKTFPYSFGIGGGVTFKL